ncbi:MAG: DUF4115 domain-containing protein [Gammaproteobacteria bacterium]|nr:DUF4115 domain-containing protein [Gammaproteobacteria bacterium]MBU1725124.1 DUF4115 domain-containing protein [Gammaproteobacteria bacterium]MBU2005006.1 DUF4115 domain-containing protein [Gammaproteobacteria bacterium]
MTENTTPVEEAKSSAVQPGDLTAKLLQCREHAGFDIEQAADEMHLSVSLLRALEKEDFTHLPEPPYVRGYLRGYAKLADQDAKELIRTYEALRGANPDDIAHHFAPARPLGKVTQPSISASTVKFIGLAVVILGLGLLSMMPGVRGWFSDTWSNFSAQTAPPQVTRPAPAIETFTARKDAEEQAAKQQQPVQADATTATPTATSDSATSTTTLAAEAAASTTAQQTPESDTDSTASATGTEEKTSTTTDGTASTAVTSTADQATTPADNTQIAAVATTASTVATPGAETTATPTVTSTATGAETTTSTADPAATAAQATPDAATAPVAAPQPIAGEVNVKLEFSEEVWMQVKDAGKKTLFESLNSAGSTKEFKASTPLDFKVGNASGVKIYLNGQEYNQAPHTKGSVARFKVE